MWRKPDELNQLIRDTLEYYGVEPTPQLINAIRKIVIQVAAKEKGKVTREMIIQELRYFGYEK